MCEAVYVCEASARIYLAVVLPHDVPLKGLSRNTDKRSLWGCPCIANAPLHTF